MTSSLSQEAPKGGASLIAPDARTRARNTSERRFRMLGLSAVGLGLVALLVLLASVLGNGLSAFRQTYVILPITLDAAVLDKSGNRNPDEMKKVTTVAPTIANTPPRSSSAGARAPGDTASASSTLAA